MTRSFSELTKDFSPERRERIEQRKEHAKALAESLQEFVWIHSGSDNGVGLQVAFSMALKALKEYREESEPETKEPLKQIIEDAYFRGFLQEDCWAAVLEALADRAQDWEKHASDDCSTTDDIRTWLRAEARA